MKKTSLIKLVKAKMFSALIIALAISSASSQTNILYGNVETFGLLPDTNFQMVLKIISPINRTWGNDLISNDQVSTPEGTNGLFSFTNVLWGCYKLFANDASGTAWTVTVPANLSNSVPIASLIGKAVPPPDPAMNYYTQAQINALLVGVSAGNGTNVTWGTTSSSTSNPQPLRIYWVYTNGLPWYGRTLTNGQN